MFLVIVLSAIALVILAAYTLSMQRTTRAVGRLLVSRPQDPITPRAQTIRYVAIFGLAVILLILASYTYAWYHGPWVLIASFVASTALPSIIGLRPGSPRLVAAIVLDLKRRQEAYLKDGDTLRGQAIEEFIEQLKRFSQEEIVHEPRGEPRT